MDEILKAILESELEDEENIDKILKAKKMSEKDTALIKGALKALNGVQGKLPKDVMGMLSSLADGGEIPEEDDIEMEKGCGTKQKTTKENVNQSYVNADGTIDIEKVPEDIRPIVSALWKDHEDAIKKANDLEKELKEEKDKRITKEYVAKASELDHLNVNAEEFGLILKAIAEKTPEQFDKFMEVLKSANEVVKQSEIFKEIGNSGTSINTAWGKIENLAKSMVQKDATMTQAQAITKVMEENPDLYTEYLKEGGK